MTPFEYVIVLISIIIGLGITTILTGIAEVIKHRPSVSIYPPYFIWIFLVFVMHVHEWWESYSLRSIDEWKLPMFLFVILYPIGLYILAHLLFPSEIRNGLNTRDFYLKIYPRIFVSVMVLITLSIIHNLLISGYHLKDQLLQFALLAIMAFLISRPIKSAFVHYFISILLLVVMLTSLLLLQDSHLTIK
jgi:hypothetical protein